MGLVTLEILIKVIMNTFAVVPLMSWSTVKAFQDTVFTQRNDLGQVMHRERLLWSAVNVPAIFKEQLIIS